MDHDFGTKRPTSEQPPEPSRFPKTGIDGSLWQDDHQEMVLMRAQIDNLHARVVELEADSQAWNKWWSYWGRTFAGMECLFGANLRKIQRGDSLVEGRNDRQAVLHPPTPTYMANTDIITDNM